MIYIRTTTLIFLLLASASFAQPELDIKPNRIEFEDLFNRFDYAFLINRGDQILTIDSIAYNDSIYIIDYENNLQLPFTILPDDSVRMNVTLSGFYYVTLTDTSDTMFVFNNGINSPKPLEVRIRFFEDEYGEFNGTVSDSLDPVDSATVYFFYNGIYLLNTTQTNSSGNYQITLPVGEYTIGVEKDGYYVIFHDSTYDPFFAEFVALNLGEVKTIDFNLKRIDDPNLSISGQIIDSTNSINIDKGIVIIRGGTHVPIGKIKYNPTLIDTINTFAGFIKPDGSYRVYTQLPDYYFLQAYTNNFLPGYYNDEGIASVYWQSADSLLIDNNIIDKNISLIRDSSWGAGSIDGFITFSTPEDQQEFEGIIIFAKNINNGALYSYNFGKELGDYKVTNIPYGTYELVAQRIGLDNAISQTVTIDPFNNQITGINLNFLISEVRSENGLFDGFVLYQNYPNPFNPSTRIKFEVHKTEFIKLTVYDILGNKVSTIINDVMPAGNYEVEFNERNLPNSKVGLSSGIYFYKLNAGGFSETKKMILLK